MARTTKSKNQKRNADEDDTNNKTKPAAKKKKTDATRSRAPPNRERKSGPESIVAQREEEAEESVENDEFDESQGAENHMMGFQNQLLKVQSLKSAALKANVARFKAKVEEREGRTIEALELRRYKKKATRAEFLSSVTSILEDHGAIPQVAIHENGDIIFDAFSSHHESLRSTSLQILRTVSAYQSTIKQIMVKDMAIGESWDKELLDAEKEIKEMAKQTAKQYERFFRSKNGGWRTMADGWERRVSKLLKNAPVPVVDSHEDED